MLDGKPAELVVPVVNADLGQRCLRGPPVDRSSCDDDKYGNNDDTDTDGDGADEDGDDAQERLVHVSVLGCSPSLSLTLSISW